IKNVIQRKDKELLKRIVDALIGIYSRNMTMISVGCDDGIEFLVKEICKNKEIRFVEVSIHFHGERRSKQEYTQFYLARNATVMELADVFLLLPSKNKQSVSDDIVDRIKLQGS